jgi:hypothetical protein
VQYWWKRGAVVIGDVNARIILTVLFYAVLFPIGVVVRRVRDPLNRRLDDGQTSQWIKRTAEPLDPARYERQF